MFVVKESNLLHLLIPKQTFFAVPVELDPKVAEAVYAIQRDVGVVSGYLQAVSMDPTAEVPECLRDVSEAPSEPQPKKKATAATSRKKSRTSSKKTVQKESDTSPTKDE